MLNMHLCIHQGMYMHTFADLMKSITTLMNLSQKRDYLKIEFEVKRPSGLV